MELLKNSLGFKHLWILGKNSIHTLWAQVSFHEHSREYKNWSIIEAKKVEFGSKSYMHACSFHYNLSLFSRNFPLACSYFGLVLRIHHVFELNTSFDHVLKALKSRNYMHVMFSTFQVWICIIGLLLGLDFVKWIRIHGVF